MLDRDGYHVLVDLLGEPGLRRRASRRLADVLAGRSRDAGRDPAGGSDRRLLAYGAASLAPPALVWTVLAPFYLVLALPARRAAAASALERAYWAQGG